MRSSEKKNPVVLLRRDAGGLLTRQGDLDSGYRLFYRSRPCPSGAVPALKREIALLQELEAPSLSRLFAANVDDDGATHLQFENITGTPLSVAMEDWGAPTRAKALKLWDELLRALQPLHEAGLPYCLMRPDRLWLSESGNLVLPEPGVGVLCCRTQLKRSGLERSRALEMFGEPWLVPPEILMQHGPCTIESDLYVVASLVAAWWLGRSPFGEGRALEIQNRMIRGKHPVLDQSDEIDDDARVLLRQCLDVAPARRKLKMPALYSLLQEHRESAPPWPAVQRPAQEYARAYKPLDEAHIAKQLEEEGLTRDAIASIDGEKLVEQLIGTATGKGLPKRARRFGGKIWLLAVVLMGAVILFLPRLMEQPHTDRSYEGKVAADSDGLTHHDMVWPDASGGTPHPKASSLMETVPVRVKEELERHNVPIRGDFRIDPPVLPPYRIICEQGDQIAVFHFTSRNRLDSVQMTDQRFQVLYKAGGTPAVLLRQGHGPDERYLRLAK